MNRRPEPTLPSCRRPPGTSHALVAVLLTATAFAPPGRGATRVEKGRGRAVIILPERPPPAAAGAARVLRDHVRQMSGTELPVRTEDRVTGPPIATRGWVLVGEGKLAKMLGLSSKGLGPGGIALSAKGHVVALFGADAGTPGDPNGTRYAVTTFLEDKLGVRYLWPGELGKVVPRRETIIVGDFEHNTVRARDPLPRGKVAVKLEYTPRGLKPGGTLNTGATVKLFVNGKLAGEGAVGTAMMRHGIEPFEVGRDSISPVSPDYKSKGVFAFTGRIEKITFDVAAKK